MIGIQCLGLLHVLQSSVHAKCLALEARHVATTKASLVLRHTILEATKQVVKAEERLCAAMALSLVRSNLLMAVTGNMEVYNVVQERHVLSLSQDIHTSTTSNANMI